MIDATEVANIVGKDDLKGLTLAIKAIQDAERLRVTRLVIQAEQFIDMEPRRTSVVFDALRRAIETGATKV